MSFNLSSEMAGGQADLPADLLDDLHVSISQARWQGVKQTKAGSLNELLICFNLSSEMAGGQADRSALLDRISGVSISQARWQGVKLRA